VTCAVSATAAVEVGDGSTNAPPRFWTFAKWSFEPTALPIAT
jgi:hypothetical protein